jgi:phage terminase small subunit
MESTTNEIEMLPAKRESFCVNYTTIGAETFGNGTKSAIAAGYSENSAYSQASALLKNPEIRQRVQELHAENMSRNLITVDKVLADLEHDKVMARQNRQYAVATRCTELQGKYLAMFTDRVVAQDTPRQIELSEAERRENRRIASLLVTMRAESPLEQTCLTPQDGGTSSES